MKSTLYPEPNSDHMALAGGVNLSIHPNKYKFLSMGQFLSSDGRCRSFGKDGSGYVPGEGVGAVLQYGSDSLTGNITASVFSKTPASAVT